MVEDGRKGIMSQANQPPVQQNCSADNLKNPTTDLSTEDKPRVIQNQPASEEEQHRAAERDYWKRQNWITGFAAAVGLVGLIFVGGTLKATTDAVQVTLDQLHSQRPYVSIGRTDGIIAEYTPPLKEGNGKGSIALYFQNTGPIAATYFLTSFKSYSNPDAKVNERHIERWRGLYKGKPFGRGFVSGRTLGADSTHVEILDSNLVPIAEEWKLIETGQMEFGFQLLGNIEYCDPWGTFHCEEFELTYRPTPVSRFVSEFNRGCDIWPKPFDPKTHAVGSEYGAESMSRCEQPEERINREKELQ